MATPPEHLVTDITKLMCDTTEGTDIMVHSVYKRSKAIRRGNFILSGLNSRHSKSNVVFAQKPGSSEFFLAEIHYFAECTFQRSSTGTDYR